MILQKPLKTPRSQTIKLHVDVVII